MDEASFYILFALTIIIIKIMVYIIWLNRRRCYINVMNEKRLLIVNHPSYQKIPVNTVIQDSIEHKHYQANCSPVFAIGAGQ